MRRPCPQRFFLSQMGEKISTSLNERGEAQVSMRIMGVVLSVEPDLLLDDGTDLAALRIPKPMQRRLQRTNLIGKTVDCIAVLRQEHCEIEQLSIVSDPHAETLRWLDICTREKVSTKNPNASLEQVTFKSGYPTRVVSENDIYEMIRSSKGVTVEELAILTGIRLPEMQSLVEELQLSGQIYHDERKLLLPL